MLPDIPTTGLTLILGGARSGKSAYAERIARQAGRPTLYVATATALDEEMRARIRHHRAARPAAWQTIEAPQQVGEAILRTQALPQPEMTVVLDCVTLWVSNVMLALPENTPAEVVGAAVATELEALLTAQSQLGGQWLVVSNEVGLGLVPPYPLGRIYRDVLGWANQRLAQAAERVLFMVAGIPMLVK